MFTTTADTPVVGTPPAPVACTSIDALGPMGLWLVRVSRMRAGVRGKNVPSDVWGVTALEGEEAALLPKTFDAVTVNVYGVPLVRSCTVVLVVVAGTVADWPPGEAVTV